MDHGTPGGSRFFEPPTTHLVANVKYLTDVLDDTTDEAEDEDEEVDKSADSLPTATTHSGKLKATSIYDIYMVDTPNGRSNNGGKDDDNDNDNNNDANNGTNGNGPEGPLLDDVAGEPLSGSEIGSLCHDEAQQEAARVGQEDSQE